MTSQSVTSVCADRSQVSHTQYRAQEKGIKSSRSSLLTIITTTTINIKTTPSTAPQHLSFAGHLIYTISLISITSNFFSHTLHSSNVKSILTRYSIITSARYIPKCSSPRSSSPPLFPSSSPLPQPNADQQCISDPLPTSLQQDLSSFPAVPHLAVVSWAAE